MTSLELTVFQPEVTDEKSLTMTPLPACTYKSTTLSALSEVADLLDSLEAHGVTEREVILLANNQFAVRWR